MRNRVDWKEVIEKVKEARIHFQYQGINPTLRTVFYWLVSKEIIPNTENYYRTLSKKIVEAKKREILPWSFLEDHVRYSSDNFEHNYLTRDRIPEVERGCEERLNSLDLEELISEYFDYITPSSEIGRWAKQPVIPEVWIEKDALARVIQKWNYDKYITVRVIRGYSSWSFIRDCVSSLKSILEEHEKVVILYLGDLDPSGVDISRHVKKAIEYFGLNDDRVEFRRLAITPEQVIQYNLPPRPEDADTLAKLERDPRKKNYSIPYIVELDALMAYVPHEFQLLVENAIDEYFDEAIYESVKNEVNEIVLECEEIVEAYKKEALRKILIEADAILRGGDDL